MEKFLIEELYEALRRFLNNGLRYSKPDIYFSTIKPTGKQFAFSDWWENLDGDIQEEIRTRLLNFLVEYISFYIADLFYDDGYRAAARKSSYAAGYIKK